VSRRVNDAQVFPDASERVEAFPAEDLLESARGRNIHRLFELPLVRRDGVSRPGNDDERERQCVATARTIYCR